MIQGRLRLRFILAGVIAGIVLHVTTGCSHLTVAPKPTEAHVVAMGSTNKPDADIIDCDGTGCLVRQAYIDAYTDLETKFKETGFAADKLIKTEGSNYRVPYLVVNHFADLKRRERLAAAGP